MPIFRIMGSSQSRPPDSSAEQPQQPQQPPTTAPQNPQRASRHTYPGLRSQAAPTPPPTHSYSYPTEQNRVGYSHATAPQIQPSPTPPVVIRGNTVVQSSGVVPSNPPPNNSSSINATPPVNTGSIVSPSNPETSRPGAYAVTRTSTGPAQVFRVTVPSGVQPGSEFSVHAGSRRVRVRCPPTSHPGQSLQITLPPEPTTHHQLLKMAPLTAPSGQTPGGGAVPMTDEVQSVNRAAADAGGTAQTFLVTIPANIYPGMQFAVNVQGQRFMVTCPPNAGPNMKVRIVPPTTREEPMAAPKTQVFEVSVPAGVRPNQPFTLIANGQRVLVTCPPNVQPGQKIRFQLPVQQVVGSIQLSYEGDTGGWCRTIRVTDLKFQWIRVNKKTDSNSKDTSEGDVVDGMDLFDFDKAAYVRKMTFLEGNDARMRTGTLEWIPAQEAVVESRLVVQNRTLFSYADIANESQPGKTLDDKTKWFQNICEQLTSPWDDGHIKIAVRRRHLLLDSVDAIMSLSREDLRKRWRIEFLGEMAIDAGGVMREWFHLTTQQLFDPDFGLWLSSSHNQMCMTINPASGVSCPEDHLIYFRFLGRIMGRALFDRQLIAGHMVRHLYKHLLGWPITFKDLEAEDEEYYQSLKKLTKMDDVSLMCLDFTVTEETLGVRKEIELVEGGAMKEVTNDNLPQYLEANLRYRMLERAKPQYTEMLLGFYDIVPEPALTVFDFHELELLLCGLPEIDIDDWEQNTIYSGLYENKGKRSHVVEWFWEVVRNDFDQEMRARLLQFVTGTSGVPARGFAVLQGNDGNIKKFAIHGVDTSLYIYPRAHTCFNRLDLPNYTSKKELQERLRASITMSSGVFDME